MAKANMFKDNRGTVAVYITHMDHSEGGVWQELNGLQGLPLRLQQLRDSLVTNKRYVQLIFCSILKSPHLSLGDTHYIPLVVSSDIEKPNVPSTFFSSY